MSALDLKVVFSAVDHMTAPLKSIQHLFKSNTQTVTENQQALSHLNKTQRDLGQFEKLQNRVISTSQAFAAAQNQLKKIAGEIKATEKPSKQLNKTFEATEKTVKKLHTTYQEQRVQLDNVSKGLKASGILTHQLASEKQRLNQEESKLNQLLAQQAQREKKLQQTQEKREALYKKGKRFAVGGGMALGLAYSIKAPLSNLLHETVATEAAQQALRMQGVVQQEALLKKTHELANNYAGLTPELILQAAAQLKSGIKGLTDEGLADLTQMTALMAKATNANITEMSDRLARSFNAMHQMRPKLTIQDYTQSFTSAFAQTVKEFKTTGPELQSALDALGNSATQAGMGVAEQFTTLGLLQQSLAASDAGAALKGFAQNAVKAEQAFEQLAAKGDNPVFVQLVNSKGQLRELPLILKDIKARYGETLDAFAQDELKQVFGNKDAVKFIATLYKQADAWKVERTAMEQATKAGSHAIEVLAQGQDQHAGARLQLIAQRWHLITEELGKALIPALEQLLNAVTPILQGVSHWIEANPKLAKTLGAIAIAVGALAAVVAPILLTLGALVVGIGLIATPIGLVAGVLAAAALLIYKFWEPISSFFARIWEGIKAVFTQAWDIIKNIVQWSPLNVILQAWEPLVNFFSHLWQTILSGVTKAMGGIKDTLFAPLKWISNLGGKLAGKIFKQKNPVITQRVDALVQPAQQQLQKAQRSPFETKSSGEAGIKQNNRVQQTLNNTIAINIQANPHMNEQQLAQEIKRQLQNAWHEQEIKQQGVLYDPLYDA